MLKGGPRYLLLAALIIISSVALYSVPAGGLTGLNAELISLQPSQNESPEASSEQLETQVSTSSNLNDGLQAYYRFDDAGVSEGYSLEFDGQDDYLSLNDRPSAFDELTVSVWVKSDVNQSDGNHRGVISSASNWDSPGFSMYLRMRSGDSGNAFAWTVNGSFVRSGTVKEDRWYHLVGVYNGSQISLYKDGDLIGQNSVSGTINPSDDVRIGFIGGLVGDSNYFDGSIDQPTIYNEALTSQEVSELWQNQDLSGKNRFMEFTFDQGPDQCGVSAGNPCLKGVTENSIEVTPQNFNDNSLDTGSGWSRETPVNRPSVRDYQGAGRQSIFFSESMTGDLKNFDFNSSSGWVSGLKGDYSLKFDGRDDFVEFRSVDKEHITVSVWARQVNTGEDTDKVLVSTDSNTRPHNAGFSLNYGWGNDLYFRVNTVNTADYKSVSDGTNLGNWYHIVGTYNGSALALYVNGEQRDVNTNISGPIESSSNPLKFGGTSDGGNYPFNGSFDNVKIYDRALSAQEVSELYNGGEVWRGIEHYYSFESGDRSKVYEDVEEGQGILNSDAFYFSGRNLTAIESGGLDNSTLSFWAESGGRWSNYVVSGNGEYKDGSSRDFENRYYAENSSVVFGEYYKHFRNYSSFWQGSADSGTHAAGDTGWTPLMSDNITTKDNALFVDFFATQYGCNHHTAGYRIVVDGEQRGLVRQTDSDDTLQKMVNLFDLIDVSEGTHDVSIQWRLYNSNTYQEAYDYTNCTSVGPDLQVENATLTTMELKSDFASWVQESRNKGRNDGSSWTNLASRNYNVQEDSVILFRGIVSARCACDDGNSWYKSRLLVDGNTVNLARAGESNDGFSIAPLVHAGNYSGGETVNVTLQWREDRGGEFVLDGASAKLAAIEFEDPVAFRSLSNSSGSSTSNWSAINQFNISTEGSYLLTQSQIAADVTNNNDYYQRILLNGVSVAEQSTGVSDNGAYDSSFVSSLDRLDAGNQNVRTEWYAEGSTALEDSKLVSLVLSKNDHFEGKIDEVRVYNRTLSQTEIEDLGLR